MDDSIGYLLNITEACRAFNTQPNPDPEVNKLFNRAITNELNTYIKHQTSQENN